MRLELFWTYRVIWKNGFTWMFWEMMYNIIMLMPVGFMAVQLFSRQLKRIVLVMLGIMLGLVISIGVEILQLVLGRGTFELDDLFHNTVGTGIGALVGDAINKNFFNPKE